MKTIERGCLICRETPGVCRLCEGTGSIGKKQVRQRAIGTDMFGQKFHGFDGTGRPTYAKPRSVSERCEACKGTGRCYRCDGKGSVVVPAVPLAREGGPARMFHLILRDDQWQQYVSGRDSLRSLPESLTNARVRKAASNLVNALGDHELEALELFEGRSGRLGWSYKDFSDELRRAQSNLEESEEPLGALEETGLVRVVVRKDAAGHFVAIEPAESEEAQLIRAIVSEPDWFSYKPRKSWKFWKR